MRASLAWMTWMTWMAVLLQGVLVAPIPTAAQSAEDLLQRTVEELIEDVRQTHSRDQRLDAIRKLAQFGEHGKSAAGALVEAFSDADPLVRKDVVLVLSYVRAELSDLMPVVIQALGDVDARVALAANQVIERLGPRAVEAVPALIVGLGHDSQVRRDNAADNLWQIGEAGLPKVLEALRQSAPVVRAGAVGVVARFVSKDVSLVSRIVQLLKDPELEVQVAALGALERCGERACEAVTDVMDRLKHEQPRVRAAAASALGTVGAKSKPAAMALLAVLNDSDSAVRVAAAKALEQNQVAAATEIIAVITALHQATAANDLNTAWALLGTVRQLGPSAKAAVPAMLKFLEQHPGLEAAWHVRACEAFRAIGPDAKPAIPYLKRQLSATEPSVNMAASNALRLVDLRVFIAAQVAVLESTTASDEARCQALGELRLLGSHAQDAVPAVTQAMSHKSSRVRQHAVVALRTLAPKAVAAAWVRALTTTDDAVRRDAMAGLAVDATDTEYPALLRVLEDPDPALRAQAVQCLKKFRPLGGSSLGTALVARLADSAPEVRIAAADTLNPEIVSPKHLSSLIPALKDEQPRVRAAVVRCLGDLAPHVGADFATVSTAITAMLGDSDPEVRLAGLSATVKALGERSVAPVATLLKDSDVKVRRAAVERLAMLRVPAAETALTEALNDSDADVRRAAKQALDSR